MKYLLIILFFFIIAVSLSFCVDKQASQTRFPQEIASVYFQKWMGGKEQSGSGTNFYIEFKEPLSAAIQLDKIYFNNQVAVLEPLAGNSFMAHFYDRKRNLDLIMDKDSLKEYGNEAPPIARPKIALKPNQALLVYKKKGKTRYFKITDPKEKPIIAYPAMNKPKN